MSKATQNQARDNAKGMATQAQGTLGPIANSAAADSSASRTQANSSLEGAGSTLKDTALPTLNSAGSSFGKMAATGGFTPEQETEYLNRATEGADASSEALQNQVKLQQARTGQGDNGGAVTRISRQLGQVKSQSLNDAQVGLNSQRNQNTLAGASGETNVGQAQADVGRAQTSVGSVQAGMAGQSAQQQMAALGLQFNTEEEAQRALTQMSTNKGPMDNIMGIGQLAAGAVGSFKGGN